MMAFSMTLCLLLCFSSNDEENFHCHWDFCGLGNFVQNDSKNFHSDWYSWLWYFSDKHAISQSLMVV